MNLIILVRSGHGWADEEKKVQVCHRSPGNPANVKIQTINQSALDTHLAHGDTLVETFYQDADGDGFGTPLSTIEGCTPPKGFVANHQDGDDTRKEVHPGATEIPGNGIDDDCKPATPDAVCPCANLSVGIRGATTWDEPLPTIACNTGGGGWSHEVRET